MILTADFDNFFEDLTILEGEEIILDLFFEFIIVDFYVVENLDALNMLSVVVCMFIFLINHYLSQSFLMLLIVPFIFILRDT